MTLKNDKQDNLCGKVALVTGGGSGIGAYTARELARLGATVVVAGRREEALHAVIDQIVAAGGRGWSRATDVTDEAAVDGLVQAIVDRFDGLHFAVNSAGDGHIGGVLETDTATFDHVMRVNAYGTYFSMRAELKALEASGGGAIVNVASIAALRGFSNLSAYAASKHAIAGLTRSIAQEYAMRGVRINAIAPGTTDTELLARLPEEARAEMIAACAMRRLAKPEEIARSILYLLCDATYSTGLVLTSDGGSGCN